MIICLKNEIAGLRSAVNKQEKGTAQRESSRDRGLRITRLEMREQVGKCVL